MPSKNNYAPYLAELLTFLDNTPYLSSQVSSVPEERIRQIKPSDIVRYMNKKAYGTPTPTDDDNPTFYRANSLRYAKKAISSFMLPKDMPWNYMAGDGRGNPTLSAEVRKVIKLVEKAETRGMGAPSRATRDLTPSEVDQLLSITRNGTNGGVLTWFGLPAFFNMQIAMGGRCDDTSQFFRKHLRVHDKHPTIALQAKYNWSKNVIEARDCPWQIQFGSFNPKFCVFISLAVWLEYRLANEGTVPSPYVFNFVGDIAIPKAGDKTKNWVEETCRKIFRGEYTVNDGVKFSVTGDASILVGNHSLKKYSYTRMRNSGISKDDADARARFKGDKRVSDVYTGMLTYPDAFAASKLSHDGAVSYRIKEGSAVTDAWIFQHVVPNIAQSTFGQPVAAILGKALLWVALGGTGDVPIHASIKTKIEAAYRDLVGDDGMGENPIERRRLIITGHEAQVVIREIPIGGGAPSPAVGGAAAAPAAAAAPMDVDPQPQPQFTGRGGGEFDSLSEREILLALVSDLTQWKKDTSDQLVGLKTEHEKSYRFIRAEITKTNNNIKRIAIQPHRMMAHAANQRAEAAVNAVGGRAVEPPATLSPAPPNLYVLWDEWIVGIGGRKPAVEFTPAERGRCKSTFSKRKVFWERVALMCNGSYTAQKAIDKIRQVLGTHLTVTQTLQALAKHRANKTMPQGLRILPPNMHPNAANMV